MFKKTSGILLSFFAALSLQTQAEFNSIEVETQKYSINIEGLKISHRTQLIANPDGSITVIDPGFNSRKDNSFISLVEWDRNGKSVDGFCKLIGKESAFHTGWATVLTSTGNSIDSYVISQGYRLSESGALLIVEHGYNVASILCK